MIRKFDYLVIGSGVAGMSFALQVADTKHRVALLCKTTIDEANTAKAQGGVAAVTDLEKDTFEKHIKDTMIAGDYISDPEAVEQVVRCAPQGIKDLLRHLLSLGAVTLAVGVHLVHVGGREVFRSAHELPFGVQDHLPSVGALAEAVGPKAHAPSFEEPLALGLEIYSGRFAGAAEGEAGSQSESH